MAQVGSVYTYVAVTFDRFVAICWPLRKRVWCTPHTSMIILAIIGAFSILFKLPAYFETRIDENGMIRPSELRESYFYMRFYNFYLYVILIQIIPWTVIISLNSVVTHKVHIAYRLQAALTNCNQLNSKNPKGRREDVERKITIMTLVITVIFILCNIPPGINNMLETLDNEWKMKFRQRIVITNLLVCVNSATNTIIYCVFNRKFRKAVLKFLHFSKAPYRSSSRYKREDQSHIISHLRFRMPSENLLYTTTASTPVKGTNEPLSATIIQNVDS
ncbi:hypothetical protein WR25_10632 [Diploscapter pachys]|uniref:G-protein coupled receptors family 1 profile domain-containing protein n=1 Tax=Diploscapter pachys TaxID=2018661 RepID=A0A2A2KZT6_9BILA|nr:hypothetical protein WR25_10632 [Diploscapter pachys]